MTERGRRAGLIAAAIAVVLACAACGGGKTGPAGSAGEQTEERGLFADVAAQVDDMALIEWHGQLTTKNPDKGGRLIFGLSGRFSSTLGYSELSMDSAVGGNLQQVDYLVVNDRTYFNSEAWGPHANSCWVEITGDTSRTWALPADLDPTWPVSAARAIGLDAQDGIEVAVPAKAVIAGMPRGLFPEVPTALDGVEADVTIVPHGRLIEVAVDIRKMLRRVPEDQLVRIDSRSAGWWAMTIRESLDRDSISAPEIVFDPAVTPPNRCRKR